MKRSHRVAILAGAVLLIAGVYTFVIWSVTPSSDVMPKTPSTPVDFDATSYLLIIINNSPGSLSNVRVSGGGSDEHFSDIAPGETIQHTVHIKYDGVLRFSGHGERFNGEPDFDKIIDPHAAHGVADITTITIDEDGVITAITEKGN